MKSEKKLKEEHILRNMDLSTTSNVSSGSDLAKT